MTADEGGTLANVSRVPSSAGSGRPPNVVTIVLDAARSKNFVQGQGDATARTPAIDRLASLGTTFPRAVAAANWTVPSHFSLFTGTYPNVHGVRTFQKTTVVPETTASFLQARGYETAMFTENLHLAGGYGLEEGFEVLRSRRVGVSREQRTIANRLTGRTSFFYSKPVRDLIERLPPLIAPVSYFFHSQELAYKADVCGRYTLDWFSEWMRDRSPERPFYAFFNFVDTHDPYAPEPNGKRLGLLERAYLNSPRYYTLSVPGLQTHIRWTALVRAYVKSIEAADRKIGEVVDTLVSRGEFDRTLVLVTSDHGQSFGESGNVYHGCGATDSVTRVPLVVVPPRGVSVPPTVDRWVSLCEVDSWIRSAANGEAPFDESGFAGGRHDATPPGTVYCEGGPASDQVRSLRGIGTDQTWNQRQLAAYRGDEKYVLNLDTGDILYWQGRGDPDARAADRIVADRAREIRRTIFGAYEDAEARRVERSAGTPQPTEVEIDERLRSWGYD